MPFFSDGEMLYSLAGFQIGVFTSEQLHRAEKWDTALCGFCLPSNDPLLMFTGTLPDCQLAYEYVYKRIGTIYGSNIITQGEIKDHITKQKKAGR